MGGWMPEKEKIIKVDSNNPDYNINHGSIPNTLWPERFQNFNLGSNGYLMVSFDNGEHYHELDTAKDVTWNVNWESADITSRANNDNKAFRPVHRSIDISTEVLLDTDKEKSLHYALLYDCFYGAYFLVGAFTSAGVGPLMWTYATIDVTEELSGLVKMSIKFNPVEFITFFLSFNEPYHPCGQYFQNNPPGNALREIYDMEKLYS